MIISDSDEVIEPAVPKERKPKGKENLAVIDPFMNPPNPLAPFSFINMLDRVLGRLAPKEQLFCPFAAVSKYPYRYVQGHDSEAVSKAYFAGGKFKARGWSL